MKRSYRAELARQTLVITEQGWYTSRNGHRVSIKEELAGAVRGTRVYDRGECRMPASDEAPAARAGGGVIEVTPESTMAAMQRLHAGGASHIGCLNFASARNPGGGFLNGAQAQEEALARSSGLYPCLMAAWDYYERNRACCSSLYFDLLIASTGVPFFRDDEGHLLDVPVPATVITAPAPNAGAVLFNEPARAPEIEPVLRLRAELVLKVAAMRGITALVLGAWGCGVFRNDPAMVAKAFGDLLKPGHPYAGHFDRVVFAIFDPVGTGENLNAFRKEFA